MPVAPRMPLTQNAPFEYGCCGLGVTLVMRPLSTVSSEPQQTEHSQQVLGKIPSAVARLDSICLLPPLRRHPEETVREASGRLEGWKQSPSLAAILRDARRFAPNSSVYMSDARRSERSRRMRYEGCAGRAGAEPQAWETAHERAYPLRRTGYREESD